MLINSISFFIFFAVVLIPYFCIMRRNWRVQNLWLLLASYFFYGWADWRMLPLLAVVTVVFYLLGVGIEQSCKDGRYNRSSCLTTIGVVVGVGLLFFFKYLNFMVDGFSAMFNSLGLHTNPSSFKIVLPIGISFFTFKLISYVVEVRRGTMPATRDFVAFATYVSFFPTVMSGPIDRPNKFIPQLFSARVVKWDNVGEGLKRILWGMFCKMCVADILCGYTDSVFDNLTEHSGISIAFATVLYAFQIYADFNGYSNMAIGAGQVMGIKVAENFMRPYLADSVSDFWRRWHISLSSWIRDYIYIPLGGNRKGKVRMYVNQLVAMTLCGLWHGANMTFVVWGFVHGMLVCLHKLFSQTVLRHDRHYHPVGLRRFFAVLLTFITVSIVWQLFRINTLSDFTIILSQMAKGPGSLFLMDPRVFTCGLLSTILMVVKDFTDEFGKGPRFLHSRHVWVRLLSVASMIAYILLFGALDGKTFIYFQF